MIRFSWLNLSNAVEITLSNGEVLIWSCKSWHRSIIKRSVLYVEDDVTVDPNIFHSLNLYLETISIDDQVELSRCYQKCYDHVELIHNNIVYLDQQLNIEINKILSIVDFDKLLDWCVRTNQLNFQIGYKSELTEKDSADQTYFTEDYRNLLVFSVWIKLVFPIWGAYCNVATPILGSRVLLLHALDIISGPAVDNNPAYTGLYSYVECLVKKKIRSNGFSLVSEISTEELVPYMVALMLWKKVCIFDPRARDRSIIKYIFGLINDQCERCVREEPRQRLYVNINGDEASIADTINISSRISPAIPIMLAYSTKYLHEYLEVDIERVEEIERYLTERNSPFKRFYIPILSAIVGKEMGVRGIELLSSNASFRRILACSAVWLQDNNYPALSELLLLIPKEKDLSITIYGGVSQTPITEEQERQLVEIYRFVAPDRPWVRWVDCIIKEINFYEWDFQIGKYSDIQFELINLLIKYNGRNKYADFYNKGWSNRVEIPA